MGSIDEAVCGKYYRFAISNARFEKSGWQTAPEDAKPKGHPVILLTT